MAEKGSRRPASALTAHENAGDLWNETTRFGQDKMATDPWAVTEKLRSELRAKGLKGFKKGGKVKKTGVYKLHKGERVQTAKQAKKAPKSAAARLRGRRI